jgi:hypothetical protein
MVLTVSFALSPVTGLVCHRRQAEFLPRDLTPASGRQDHTTSPSALAHFVKRAISVHRIPFPTSVTIASRPSLGTRRRAYVADLRQTGSGIFLLKGIDSNLTDLPVRQNQAAKAWRVNALNVTVTN